MLGAGVAFWTGEGAGPTPWALEEGETWVFGEALTERN